MTQNDANRYFAPDGSGKAKIEEVYIRNAALNQIIARLKIDHNSQDDKAADSDAVSNYEKRRKRIFEGLGIDQQRYKDTDGKHNSYPLEDAAIIIAIYFFPPRAKDTLPMQVMQNRINEVSGDQLLAFLHLASEISLILYKSLSSEFCCKDGESLYVQKVTDLIQKYWEEHKEQFTKSYDEYPFRNILYSDNSDRFNELVMYANIKSMEDNLHNELSDMTGCFLKGLFTYRGSRADVDDLLDAFNLIKIADGLNELDVHTAICAYSKKMSAYSCKLEDVIEVWKRITTSQEWDEIKSPLKTKDEVFDLLSDYFDRPHDLFHTVYEAICLEYSDSYLETLYKEGLSFIIAYYKKVDDARVITQRLISTNTHDLSTSMSTEELVILTLPSVIEYLDSPFFKDEGLSLYQGIKKKYPEEYLEKLAEMVIGHFKWRSFE